VPSSSYIPSSLPNFYVSDPTMVSSSDDNNKDENRPLFFHLPPIGSIEHEPAPTPPLLKWAPTTREATSDLVNDPTDQHRTYS
jgi:hypothetical protein